MPYKSSQKKLQRAKEYYRERREKVLEYYKKRYEETPEIFKERKREYYKNNTEKLKARSNRYRPASKQSHQDQLLYEQDKNREITGKSPARTIELIKALDRHFKRNNDITKLSSIILKDDLKYEYTEEEQLKEYKNLKTKRGDINSKQSSNKCILSNQDHYYEKEKKLWKENKDNVRERIVLNRKRHLDRYKNEYQLTERDALRGFKISGEHIGFTHFNPLWLKWFIEKYSIKSIYDPCGGWGHRMMGAHELDLYVYNDYDPRTVEGCKKIAQKLGIKNTVFHNSDSSKFVPKESYEAVFTCPPYYNVETYNDKTFKDLEDYKNWWRKTVSCSLKPDVKYFAFVINHDYINDLKTICEEEGLCFIEEQKCGVALGHFTRSAKKIFRGEYLVVYKRS